MTRTEGHILKEADDAIRAVVAGVPADGRHLKTPSLARALRPVADALAEPLRGFAFGPAIEPAPGADAASSLLDHLGRRADWTA
ncbi:hypothetical protein ACFYY2_08065 [Streptomyces sp. NPDC001822]|uniref:hypothetical protein n=1 Tax=Streptomyces sp. NPDC001822 TaxID=3364614 RepID=UPI0036A7C8B9